MDNKKINDFTDLIVWQKAHELVMMIYKLTDAFPKKEVYSLTSQLRRAVVSITSNIAEGFGRRGSKEKSQFYYVAKGSLTELKNQLIISRDVGYLSDGKFILAESKLTGVSRLLQGLINKNNSG